MNSYNICENSIPIEPAAPVARESVTSMLKQSEETLLIINSNLSFVLKYIAGGDYDDYKVTPPENMIEATDNVRILTKLICDKTNEIMELLGVR